MIKKNKINLKSLFFGRAGGTFLIITLLYLITSATSCTKQSEVQNIIIPQPQTIIQGNGSNNVYKLSAINYNNASLREEALVLQEILSAKTEKSITLSTDTKSNQKSVNLIITEGFSSEGYKLEINKKEINCYASTKAGMFYAVQSLAQLINTTNNTIIPSLTIEDHPQYQWRGFMLDEARHFFGKEIVKQYLDIMARLKLNRFHWHLTDEQGWRIEIKKYPLLTTVGGQGNWSDRNAPVKYYTQEEIKEIVEYAQERNITIIPEIDMPGHATAASRSYPYISGGGTGKWNGFTFHPAKETTYQFIDDIFTEIAALFPGPYIHFGGDEVHYGNQSWFTDPVIQKFIKDNDLKDEIGMEHYFVRRVCDIINSKGKKALGWDELIFTGVTPEQASVLWWRHDKPEILAKALQDGFDVILCPRIPCYFDFVQDNSHTLGRRWEGNFNTIERVYHFSDSISPRIEAHKSQIMGMQANIFSERIADKKRLDFMLFPRLLALAENAWSNPAQKDYNEFIERVRLFMPYLDSYKINYFDIFDVENFPEPLGPDREDEIAEG